MNKKTKKPRLSMKLLRQMNAKYRANTKWQTTLEIEKFLSFVESN